MGIQSVLHFKSFIFIFTHLGTSERWTAYYCTQRFRSPPTSTRVISLGYRLAGSEVIVLRSVLAFLNVAVLKHVLCLFLGFVPSEQRRSADWEVEDTVVTSIHSTQSKIASHRPIRITILVRCSAGCSLRTHYSRHNTHNIDFLFPCAFMKFSNFFKGSAASYCSVNNAYIFWTPCIPIIRKSDRNIECLKRGGGQTTLAATKQHKQFPNNKEFTTS